jgi:hypothetical protein
MSFVKEFCDLCGLKKVAHGVNLEIQTKEIITLKISEYKLQNRIKP